MNISTLQVFDEKSKAIEALAAAKTALPDNDHKLIETSDQVQVLTNVGGKSEIRAYGDVDDKSVYLVLSIAK